jgi:hypothetical protein
MRLILVAVLACALAGPGAALAQGFRMQCHVQSLCPGVEPGGGRIMNCLRAHKDELSEPCLAAIGRMALNRRANGQSGPGTRQGGAAQGGPMQGEGEGDPDDPGGQQPPPRQAPQ